MSELQPKFENKEHVEAAAVERQAEHASLHYEKAAEQASSLSPEKALDRVEEALEHQEKPKHAKSEKHVATPLHTNGDLRAHNRRQALKRTQKKLSKPDRTFSKFIHNNAVETASDIGGGTVARPSGLLFGGLFSLISSVAVLIICRRYGYEYNFLVGSACFVGGFAVGILLEGFSKLTRTDS